MKADEARLPDWVIRQVTQDMERVGIPKGHQFYNALEVTAPFVWKAAVQHYGSGLRVRHSLSKNALYVLAHAYKLHKKEGFARTKDFYPLKFKGSITAELSKLKYLGAIYQYFNEEDEKKVSKRSGKWIVSKEGFNFLHGRGRLPSFVKVEDQQVVEVGEGWMIDNKNIAWMHEDDYWKEFMEEIKRE